MLEKSVIQRLIKDRAVPDPALEVLLKYIVLPALSYHCLSFLTAKAQPFQGSTFTFFYSLLTWQLKHEAF
jgi:hypothetical protein